MLCQVAALIAANPATVKPVSDAQFAKLMTADGTPIKFKVTVIIVNNTLVQQWTDELRKFARIPSLVPTYDLQEEGSPFARSSHSPVPGSNPSLRSKPQDLHILWQWQEEDGWPQ